MISCISHYHSFGLINHLKFRMIFTSLSTHVNRSSSWNILITKMERSLNTIYTLIFKGLSAFTNDFVRFLVTLWISFDHANICILMIMQEFHVFFQFYSGFNREEKPIQHPITRSKSVEEPDQTKEAKKGRKSLIFNLRENLIDRHIFFRAISRRD